MGARVPQITLIFLHKNKPILTEFPWLVKELQGIVSVFFPLMETGTEIMGTS
jgi:hypothetical protein